MATKSGLWRRHRLGFTKVELLVVVLLVLVLITVFLPALFSRRGGHGHGANRVKCASNLRQIGQALLLYANENGNSLPFVRYEPGAPPAAYTGAVAGNPFAADGPQPNDVTAALYLLVRTQDIGLEAFICFSANAEKWQFPAGKTALDFSNFPGEQHLSYSFNNFYAPAGLKYPATLSISPEFAVAADMNPGTAELLTLTPDSPPQQRKKGNSYNHDQDGQNVLYGDGHVEFQNTPFVGIKKDNIYTAGSGAQQVIVGLPAHAEDSILLPAAGGAPAGFGGPSPLPQRSGITIVLWVVGIFILLAIGWYVLVARRLTAAT